MTALLTALRYGNLSKTLAFGLHELTKFELIKTDNRSYTFNIYTKRRQIYKTSTA